MLRVDTSLAALEPGDLKIRPGYGFGITVYALDPTPIVVLLSVESAEDLAKGLLEAVESQRLAQKEADGEKPVTESEIHLYPDFAEVPRASRVA